MPQRWRGCSGSISTKLPRHAWSTTRSCSRCKKRWQSRTSATWRSTSTVGASRRRGSKLKRRARERRRTSKRSRRLPSQRRRAKSQRSRKPTRSSSVHHPVPNPDPATRSRSEWQECFFFLPLSPVLSERSIQQNENQLMKAIGTGRQCTASWRRFGVDFLGGSPKNPQATTSNDPSHAETKKWVPPGWSVSPRSEMGIIQGPRKENVIAQVWLIILKPFVKDWAHQQASLLRLDCGAASSPAEGQG